MTASQYIYLTAMYEPL